MFLLLLHLGKGTKTRFIENETRGLRKPFSWVLLILQSRQKYYGSFCRQIIMADKDHVSSRLSICRNSLSACYYHVLSRSHPLHESRSKVGKALRDDPTKGFERE